MRPITTIAASVTMAALAASPALADSGAPGSTFPEQPGSHPQTGCAALVSRSGALSAPRSEGVHDHQWTLRRRLFRRLA